LSNNDILLTLILVAIAYLAHNYAQLYFEVQKIKEAVMPGEASSIEFYAIIAGRKQKVESMFLKVSQKLPISLAIKDIKGNAAKIDGAPKWAVTNEALASLVVAEDGLSAELSPVGPVGSFKVQVKADADLSANGEDGSGVKEIVGELEIELVAGDAAVVELAAGVAVDL
jgi:hypothetical protein